MATFKIGQRVRIVDSSDMTMPDWIGCEVTILALPGFKRAFPDDYQITKPSTEPQPIFPVTYGCPRHHLAPLTDPGADAFIKRIKRIVREPNNVVEKVTVEVLNAKA